MTKFVLRWKIDFCGENGHANRWTCSSLSYYCQTSTFGKHTYDFHSLLILQRNICSIITRTMCFWVVHIAPWVGQYEQDEGENEHQKYSLNINIYCIAIITCLERKHEMYRLWNYRFARCKLQLWQSKISKFCPYYPTLPYTQTWILAA